ncbi:MAG TPA: DUF262 domain-containing protein [Methylomirabilota bacterium]|nr:DUF262 domain-containing protein [Methylomirabilota bacterium]
MPTHLTNLDALIRREDFEATEANAAAGNPPIFKIEELEKGRLYFSVLRKPDFQRSTNNWSPQMVVDLVKSALDNELIPALIIWHSQQSGKVYVVDGAHRLSALIAWVNDDYGNGAISKEFFGTDISPAQVKFHNKTKELMDGTIGPYATVARAGNTPTATDDPNMVRRGRAIATYQPPMQAVIGDAKVAESSFLRINAKPATIDPTDLDVIRARKKPNAIATRALMRAGASYIPKLAKAGAIENLAREVYGVIFGPIVDISTASPDVPRAGQPYSSEAFKMILDMVNIFNDVLPAMWQKKDENKISRKKIGKVQELADDHDGSETLTFLGRVKEIGALVCDNGTIDSGSLGLDPAVYFYGATGKFHPPAFLATMKFVKELKTNDNFYAFTKVRNDFEEFLVRHRFFINQIGHSKGSRTRPLESMLLMFGTIFSSLRSGITDDANIVAKLKSLPALMELNDISNIPADMTKKKRFSKSVQQAATVRQILENRERCPICHARLHPSARSKDHKLGAVGGGTGSIDNLQFTHPYCNTGYKQKQLSDAKK